MPIREWSFVNPPDRGSSQPSAAEGSKKRSTASSSSNRSSAANRSSRPTGQKPRSASRKKGSSGKNWLLPIVGGILAVVAIDVGVVWFVQSSETASTQIADSNDVASNTAMDNSTRDATAAQNNSSMDVHNAATAAATSTTANITSTASNPPGVASSAQSEVDVATLLTSMLQFLESGDANTFVMKHAPVRDFKMFSKLIESGEPVPPVPPQLVELVTRQIQQRQSLKAVVSSDGQSLRFVSLGSGMSSQKPQLKNPLNVSDSGSLPGYGSILPEVIKQAISDLKQNKGLNFASRILPPSVVAVLKFEGRWDQLAETFGPGIEQTTRMIEDLNQLLILGPQMQGNTATYLLDRNVTQFASGRDRRLATVKDGTREIRFSNIGGHWRFYDQLSEVAHKIDVALDQELMDAPSPELEQLTLEKDGDTWRLKAFPPKR